MTDIQIFLMWTMWISVVVSMLIIIAEFCCDVEDMAARIAGLWGIQLIVAIWATVNHFLLLPMTIVSVVIMIIAIIMALTDSYIDFKVLFAYLLKLPKAQQDDQPSEPATKKKWPKVIGRIILIIAIICLCGWVFDRSTTLVEQGERGVKTTWGKVVPKSYGPSLVFTIPFTEKYGNKVIKVPIRPENYGYSVPVRTKDLQKITLECSVFLQLTPDSVHVLYDKYTGYQDYEKKVVRDLVQSTMLALSSQMSFWSFAEETSMLMSEAIKYIVNDQLMSQNLAKIGTFRLKGYQASEEIEALIDKTAQARQGVELEKWRLEKAKIETERVKQEALQTFERLAAVARANGIDVQIKAEALRNPFVAQYEAAKALQNWKGDLTLPNTLMTMSSAANGSNPSFWPIIPIRSK